MPGRLYRYVGPAHIRGSVKRESHCIRVDSALDAMSWASGYLAPGKVAGSVPATFIVDGHGDLWIADRRSEHVACADGGLVLAAGEMMFEVERSRISVMEVSNQSTGYCPEPDCWTSVAAVLDRLEIARPEELTASFLFRKCVSCEAINVIKDDMWDCELCGKELPREWNF